MKFGDLARGLPLAESSLNGVFMRDVPYMKVKELQKLAAAQDEEKDDLNSSAVLILWMFQNILCDQNGAAFEDVNTLEDIDNLPIVAVKGVMIDITNLLGDEGKD